MGYVLLTAERGNPFFFALGSHSFRTVVENLTNDFTFTLFAGHIYRQQPQMTDDREIIKAMQENPEQGFRLLMANYKEPVYWHIRRLVVNHADAQDAAQEAFVRIFRNFSQYSEENSFRAWIFRIATNEALRILVSQKSVKKLSFDDVTADILSTKADAFYDSSDAIAVRLQKAILHLPAKQQLAFNLRYYDELSYEEIAEVADSSAASAKMNYHLAKEKIIEYMRKND